MAVKPFRITADLRRRLHAGVDRSRGRRACWPWLRSTVRGYGAIGLGKRVLYAHRVAYAVAYGSPGRAGVLHRCDTPRCCNPRHLFVGDQRANMRDCADKRRHSHGERHGCARLTAAVVRAIRRAHAAGARNKDIAARFGISPGHACMIYKRHRWKHLPV